MKARTLIDILWAALATGAALAGIFACAWIQGSINTPGIRLALVSLAIAIGGMGGAVLARLTTRRRRRHRTGHSRRSRRHMRTVAFVFSGILIACTVVALSLRPEIWLLGLGAGGVAVTWLWYAIENAGLSRGAVSPVHRRTSSRRAALLQQEPEDEEEESDGQDDGT